MIRKCNKKDIQEIVRFMKKNNYSQINTSKINELICSEIDELYGLFVNGYLNAIMIINKMHGISNDDSCMTLRGLRVCIDKRRLGYGKKMLIFFEKLALERKVNYVYFITSNPKAKKLYNDFGFKENAFGNNLSAHVKRLEI